ncbi:hypothetical protein P9112_007513 [Eukaryota sp. TZLM1-RC]
MDLPLSETGYFITVASRCSFDGACRSLSVNSNQNVQIDSLEADGTLWKVEEDGSNSLYRLCCIDASLDIPLYLTSSLSLSENKDSAALWNMDVVEAYRNLNYTTTVQFQLHETNMILCTSSGGEVELVQDCNVDTPAEGILDEFHYNKHWCLVPDLDLREEDVFSSILPEFSKETVHVEDC